MALLTSGFQFTGSLGSVSAYRMKGSDKIVVRTKGGPSKTLIATGKQFDITRRNNSEFGRRSKASAIVLNAMQPLRSLADYKISGAVNAILKQIQELDTASTFGQRDIYLSRRPGLFEGFSFNKENTFDKSLSAPVRVETDPMANSLTVIIPEIVHGTNLRTSNRYPYRRIVATAACVPDLVWREHGYHAKVNVNTGHTDWRSVTADADEERLELTYSRSAISNETLLVSIGLQYGTVSSFGDIVPVNYGCAKVLLAKAFDQGYLELPTT